MAAVKVRIGVSLALDEQPDAPAFGESVDELEERGIDSLWLSELVYSPLIDPFIGMAYAISRTRRLKVGTGVAVLPGRSPILVAKQLASLARLAPKRVLPVFGLSPARPAERVAFPVPDGQRGAVFDESLELLRLLLREPRVSYSGKFFSVEDATVGELPPTPLDIWLGGSAPAGLRRIGRFADGWLASFITPDEAAAGIGTIVETARAAGRQIDPEHYGISLPIAFGEVPPILIEAIRVRRSDVAVDELIPRGWEAAQRLIERYIAAGMSKFVIRAVGSTMPSHEFLSGFIQELSPLET